MRMLVFDGVVCAHVGVGWSRMCAYWWCVVSYVRMLVVGGLVFEHVVFWWRFLCASWY